MTTPAFSHSKSLFDGIDFITKPMSKLFKHTEHKEMSRALPSSNEGDPDQSLTIIELFQSQGCNSCPPANAKLLDLVNKTPELTSNILLLTYHVTYWDYLGWPDPFGQKTFDQRQRDYVKRMQLRSAFTPQVVVNGKSSGVGNLKGDLRNILQQAGSGHDQYVKVSVIPQGSGEVAVSVSSGHESLVHPLEVTLVRFDPTQVDVSIPRGENAGRMLPHINVVKEVRPLGRSNNGEEGVFMLRLQDQKLWSVVLVQDGQGGPIVGATRL
jgi:hypothetical protein